MLAIKTKRLPRNKVMDTCRSIGFKGNGNERTPTPSWYVNTRITKRRLPNNMCTKKRRRPNRQRRIATITLRDFLSHSSNQPPHTIGCQSYQTLTRSNYNIFFFFIFLFLYLIWFSISFLSIQLLTQYRVCRI